METKFQKGKVRGKKGEAGVTGAGIFWKGESCERRTAKEGMEGLDLLI